MAAPPPEDEDGESGDDQAEQYPYVSAEATSGKARVVAGWAEAGTGEPVGSPVVDYEGGAGSPAALSAYEAALEWYRDVVAALVEQEREAAPE
jgi:hypothetical protein